MTGTVESIDLSSRSELDVDYQYNMSFMVSNGDFEAEELKETTGSIMASKLKLRTGGRSLLHGQRRR